MADGRINGFLGGKAWKFYINALLFVCFCWVDLNINLFSITGQRYTWPTIHLTHSRKRIFSLSKLLPVQVFMVWRCFSQAQDLQGWWLPSPTTLRVQGKIGNWILRIFLFKMIEPLIVAVRSEITLNSVTDFCQHVGGAV